MYDTQARGSQLTSAIFRLAFPVLALMLLSSAFYPETSRADESVKPLASRVTSLDGEVFSGEIGSIGEPARSEDVLMFKDGMFSSAGCKEYGFADAPYWLRFEGQTLHFLAETVSPTHGTIVWRGTIKGDELEASYAWTKERWYWTIHREYWFKGARKQ